MSDIVNNNPAPILRIYNAYYIWYSELFDIVNKNGPMDLFVISKFECVYRSISIFCTYTVEKKFELDS